MIQRHDSIWNCCTPADIVKEILENRAEIYQALSKATPEEDVEEEGPSIQEMLLRDHLKLKEAIEGVQITEEVTDQ